MSRPGRKTRTASLHDEAYRRFVARLAEARVASGLSQAALAEKLRWNQSIVAKIETAQRRIDLIEYVRFASAIGQDASRIVRQLQKELTLRIRSQRGASKPMLGADPADLMGINPAKPTAHGGSGRAHCRTAQLRRPSSPSRRRAGARIARHRVREQAE